MPTDGRPGVRGKFLEVAGERLLLKGVTYGTFRPQPDQTQYGASESVERDFRNIAATGLNSVRVYTVPPVSLLDTAQRHGLRVLIGLPWEQHITFLDDKNRAADIRARVGAGVRQLAGHPAVLGYAVGNEIPADIVRWHGASQVQDFIKSLYLSAKDADPAALVTYVNFPTTEYLDLSFLDYFCFNVYLEQRERMEAYMARLQSLAGDRPLVMAEIGLDSLRNGVERQAAVLDWQVRSAFAGGAAGAFLFSWTDEWYRGGFEVEDWDFGLVNRARVPKPALAAVTKAFAEVPFPREVAWPRVSVVVCSYNGHKLIRETVEHLQKLNYPDYEVIVVDDGSNPPLAPVLEGLEFRLIRTENGGLSSARNVGMQAATGEIISYIDDDAYPDPDWLRYLVWTFLTTDCAAAGGPNLPPPGDGTIADCVARAPGGPLHVLLTDTIAEHIPGCNTSVRKSALEAIGGFDPIFRVAGDDVDMNWRIQAAGGYIGFSPAAVVWHHRRNSVKTFWKQQKGYGKAEALLENKWPEKYNAAGHASWHGRIYGKGLARLPWLAGRIYHGQWSSAPFQSLYEPAIGGWNSLFLMPEWLAVVGSLVVLALLGLAWKALWIVAAPAALLALGATLYTAWRNADRAWDGRAGTERLLTALLYLMQPVARLWGRLYFGVTPWRLESHLVWPWKRDVVEVWSESWRSREYWLDLVRHRLAASGARVVAGGDFDEWDLAVRGGILGSARLRMAVEEHGGGRQMVKFGVSPEFSKAGVVVTALLLILAERAVHDSHFWIGALTGWAGLALGMRILGECGAGRLAIGNVLAMLKLGTE